jgi:hypothetical protein
MEESISKAAGATFGEFVAPEEFRRMIRSIGRVPAERGTTYKIRRMFDSPEVEVAETNAPLAPAAIGTRAVAALPVAQEKNHQPYAEGAY